MPEAKNLITAFLRNYVLFSSFDEELLEKLVNAVEVVALKPGEILYAEGEVTDDFYVVWSGKLHLLKNSAKGQKLATLIIGDFFGEDWLVSNQRLGTMEALVQTKVLKFDRILMEELFVLAPKLKKLLTTTAKSCRMAYNKRLRWLGEDEGLYLIARKHRFFLAVYLVLPVMLFLGGLYFVYLSLLDFEYVPLRIWLAAIITGAAALWILWLVVDWGNDYYVVTSQRVLWIEKMIAIYDSRQEAPLDTILTMNKISNQTLRMLIDYGTVIVKTYTGSIVMRWSQYPDEMLLYIDGFKARARAIARQYENEAMEAVLSRRLGLDVEDAQKPKSIQPVQTKKPKESKFFLWLRNALKMRYVVGNNITFRKHWFILLKKTFFPGMVSLIIIVVAVYLYANEIFRGLPAILLWSLFIFGSGLWWLYNYIDWRNDIYVLTLDKIFDIERKPLAREEKREASLSNILSLENARLGLLGLLLNFGTVTINVGTEKLTFDNVFNPVQVQYEISDRMYALSRRKEEQEAAKERERVADWLMAYHRQLAKIENFENFSQEEDISG